MANTALSRLWEITRHVLSVRGLLQWTGWWQPMSAAIFSPSIGVWSVLKGMPGPVAVLIGMVGFVVVLIAWRFITLTVESRSAWLRVHAAEVSGSLFAILVETGERLDAPPLTTEKYADI